MKKLIQFDWALKKLLRHKSNFGILEGFLSVLLKRDILIKNINDPEGNKQDSDDKFNRVDILAETVEKELIIIELQVENQVDYFQRMAYGTSKVLTEYINAGDEYLSVKKIYSVNIVYFDFGQGNDYVYHGLTEFRGLHTHDILQLSAKQLSAMKYENVSEIFPEYYVLKVNDFNDFAKDSLDQWIYMLKNAEVLDNFTAKGIKEAKEKLDVEKLSPEEKAIYKRHLENMSSAKSTIFTARHEGEQKGLQEGEQIGLQKGEQIGLQKGLQKGQLIPLFHPLRAGKSPEQIADFTGISIEIILQVKQLIEKYGADAEKHL